MVMIEPDDAGVVQPDPHDLESFSRMIREHDRRLRALAFRLLAGDASRLDDVLQEAYVNAYRALGRFRGGSDPGGWLYRITYNACMDELRRARRRPVPLEVVPEAFDRDRAPGPEQRAVQRDDVARALAVLTPDQRAVIALVDGNGFDLETAAGIVGVATGTVKSRLSRARAAMRAALGEEHR
jgi:RNA polymerase sigma-70 factor (ECF subfamily)